MDIAFQLVLIPVIVAVSSSVGFLVFRSVAFGVLHKWAKRAGTSPGELSVAALKTPSFFWCIAGLYSGVATLDLQERHVLYVCRVINILVICPVTIVASRLSGKLLRDYVQRSNLPIPTTGLATGILTWTILVVGVLNILGVLGISSDSKLDRRAVWRVSHGGQSVYACCRIIL